MSVAVIVDVVVAATPFDVTVNVPVVAPAATVTDAGIDIADVLPAVIARVIVSPLGPGAGALSVTVPVELMTPPVTEVGLSVNDARIGVTVSVCVRILLPLAAVMITAVLAATAVVLRVKVVDVEPAGTVTIPGLGTTVVLLVVTLTGKPPTGAAEFKVIVPVDVCRLPQAVVGLIVNVLIGLVKVSVAVTALLAGVCALIVGDTVAATPTVVAVNVPVVVPARTVTDGGRVTLGLPVPLTLNGSTRSPTGAGPLRVTVPVELAKPPTTVAGLIVSDNACGRTVRFAVRVCTPITA